MTTDIKELRTLVDACKAANCADQATFDRHIGDLYEQLTPEMASALLDEIEALRETVAVLQKIRDSEVVAHDLRAQVMEKQDKEIELLRGNAALMRQGYDRYKWLRSRDVDTIRQGGVFAGVTPDNLVINGEDLDRHIDAAMAEAVH